MQRIEETFDIARPVAEVYDEINNVGEIGYAIAGVKEVRVLSDTESQWKIEARAGFLSKTVELRGRIVERRPPQYLGFEGDGRQVKVTGHIDLTQLDPSVTRCHVLIEAHVAGALGPIADLIAKGPQQKLIRDTVANLKQRLERKAA
jgi:carbon monoxide dehydrogenase subunit G